MTSVVNTQKALSAELCLFDKNPHPMWVYDRRSLAFLAVNEAAIEHYGYSREEFLSKSIADIRPQEDLPALHQNIAQVETGLDYAGVWRHRRKNGEMIYVEITSFAMEFQGRPAELVLAYDVTARIRTEQDLRHRLAFERVVADIAAQFAVAGSEDAATDYALQRMGEFSGADRAYLFQFSADRTLMANTHEWCAPGVTPQIRALQGLHLKDYPWSIKQLMRGDVVAVPDVERMPPEAEPEQEALRAQGIRSVILVPLLLDDDAGGFVGFDNVSDAAPWNEVDHALLTVAAEIITNSLQRRRSDVARRSVEEHLGAFMRSAVGFAVYRLALDPNSPYSAVVDFASPSMCDVIGIDPSTPFPEWFQHVHPEDRAKLEEAHAKSSRTGATFDVTLRMFHKEDGEWRWIHAVSNPARDTHGRVTHFNGVMLDVTQSVAASLALGQERDFVSAVMDTVGALIVVMDAKGAILRFNRACEATTEYNFAEVEGRRVWDFLLLPEEKAVLRRLFDRFVSGDFPNRHINYWLSKSGRKRLIAWSNTAIVDDNKTVQYVIATGIDITEQTEAERSLRKLNTAVEQGTSGLLILDQEGRAEFANPAYLAMSGKDAGEVLGKRPAFLGGSPGEGRDSRQNWDTLRAEGSWRSEFEMTRGAGQPSCWAWISVSPVNAPSGEADYFVAVLEDVTELKTAREHLEHLASFDVLTGLPNRRLFRDRLDQALKSALRHDQPVTLLYLDLDNFKRINDSLGHDAGDDVLHEVAGRLSRCVRDEDTVARFGGDEFVILLPQTVETAGAKVVADKILRRLSEPIRTGDRDVVITSSIGISKAPAGGADANSLLRSGDVAMYRAKAAGRNRYVLFNDEMNREAQRRLSVEADLRQALKDDGLELHYQPIVDLSDGRVVGFEALARWFHPVNGPIPPDQFIPVAEESGLILPIGQRLLHQAIERISHLRQALDRSLYVSVNLSVHQLQERSLPAIIEEAFRACELPPSALVLELTETLLMSDVRRIGSLLQRLRDLGVRIAVDDFGTGYSSLGYLKALPVDTLKVDRSFVRDLPDDHNDAAIAKAVIAMGHSLGLDVLAEGIETNEQLEHLRADRCDLAQGYLFGRPMPGDHLDSFLRASARSSESSAEDDGARRTQAPAGGPVGRQTTGA